MSRGVNAKPPNVLVLCCGGQNQRGGGPDPLYSAVRDGLLRASLDHERYAVYPLSLGEAASRAPWRDNCRLLVVPRGLGEVGEVLTELASFVAGGGTLLSTHAPTNAAFGFAAPDRFRRTRCVVIKGVSPLIEQPEEWIVARTSPLACETPTPPPVPLVLPSLDQTTKLSVLARMRELESSGDQTAARRGCGQEREEGGGGEGKTCGVEREKADDTVCEAKVEAEDDNIKRRGQEEERKGLEEGGDSSDAVDCIQHLQFEGNSGQAILSHVDLFSSLVVTSSEEEHASLSEIVALKRDAEKLSGLLRSVLGEVEMECSEGENCAPTLSYLVCSEKVCVCVHMYVWHSLIWN